MNRLLAIAAGIGLATVAGAQGKPATSASPLQYTSQTKAGEAINIPVAGSHSTSRTLLNLDISGEQSWDGLGDSSNTTLFENLGQYSLMTGIGWDVNLATVGGSWLSEAKFYFDGSDQDYYGLFLTPGFATSSPGTGYYTNSVLDLTANGIPDIPIGADGDLWIQLYEGFDDVPDAVDANWLAPSSLQIEWETGTPPPPLCGYWVEQFEGTWPPSGWTVIDNSTSGYTWNTNTWYGVSNSTPGSGVCATIDSDAIGTIHMDGELWTASFTVAAGAKLRWEMDYQNFGGIDNHDVDISIDAGGSWTTLVSYNSDLTGTFELDLSAYAGASAIIRFHYYYPTPNWLWWAKVDDVAVQANASASFRNAGTNPATLTLTGPPVLGGSFSAMVDVSASGHAVGWLQGYSGALTFTLGGGQTVLIDFTDPLGLGELTAAPFTPGPIATWPFNLPAVCALHGLGANLQGVAFGGPPWVLTNAQDTVVGY